MSQEPKVAGVCATDVGEKEPESGLRGEGKDGPRDGHCCGRIVHQAHHGGPNNPLPSTLNSASPGNHRW